MSNLEGGASEADLSALFHIHYGDGITPELLAQLDGEYYESAPDMTQADIAGQIEEEVIVQRDLLEAAGMIMNVAEASGLALKVYEPLDEEQTVTHLAMHWEQLKGIIPPNIAGMSEYVELLQQYKQEMQLAARALKLAGSDLSPNDVVNAIKGQLDVMMALALGLRFDLDHIPLSEERQRLQAVLEIQGPWPDL